MKILRATLLFLALPIVASASLSGPWHRFTSREMGVEFSYVPDWRVAHLKNALLFALDRPDVRLAVGRIQADGKAFEPSIKAVLQSRDWTKTEQHWCRVGGRRALRIDGLTSKGPARDYYIDNGSSWYWLSFTADRLEGWDAYHRSFDIIVEDFRFL